MKQNQYITIISNGRKILLGSGTILYVSMAGKTAEIHVSGGKVYKTRATLSCIEQQLGDGFIKIHRGCIVASMAIHDVTDKINLSSGESLIYTIRKKKQIISQLETMQKRMISGFASGDMPVSPEQYRAHYSGFENMPFAFADIEMIFSEQRRAVDWIFRYGNPALARLEKVQMNELIGASFGSLFSNMDSKWLRAYERATLYGEIIEMADYSPEIDAYIKIICFPTLKGHCGCILFDMEDIRFMRSSSLSDGVMAAYLSGARMKNGNRSE